LGQQIPEVFEKQFKGLINMCAPYHLLPSYELLSAEYLGEQCKINLDGVQMTFNSEDDLWDFYCSRPWAKMSNGELRPAMQEWLDFRNSMYVTMPDGSKVLSATLVDTTYFTGDNFLNDNVANLVTNEDDTISLDTTDKTMHGDGTVPYASAVAMEKDTSKIVAFNGVSHYAVNYGFKEIAQESTYTEIDEAIKNNNSPLVRLWFKN
jgi:hypothetical protein